MATPNGKLQQFILTAIPPKKGKTRGEIETAYAEHLGTTRKAPGTYQALRSLVESGLVEATVGAPTGTRGRTPYVYTLTDAGVEARKALKKLDRAA